MKLSQGLLCGIAVIVSLMARPVVGQETKTAHVKVTIVDKKTRRVLPSLPIEAKLIVTKTTYQLNLLSDTNEEFRKKISDLEKANAAFAQYPPRPAINGYLELKNASKEQLSIDVQAPIKVTLDGKGAVSISVPGKITGQSPKNQFVQPGGTITVPIWWDAENDPHSSKLRSFWIDPGQNNGAFLRSYWTDPGTYQLKVRYITNVMDVYGRANWDVNLESEPIVITVKRR